MELIFIGRSFYNLSGTQMSSLYTTVGERSDWGSVEKTLSNGESVSIKPATILELKPYFTELNRIRDLEETQK